MSWAINWRGTRYNSSDLTGEHAGVVAELLGFAPSWEWFHIDTMHPAHGPLQTMALIAAFVCVAEQVHGNAARQAILAAVKDADLDELVNAIVLPVAV